MKLIQEVHSSRTSRASWCATFNEKFSVKIAAQFGTIRHSEAGSARLAPHHRFRIHERLTVYSTVSGHTVAWQATRRLADNFEPDSMNYSD